MWKLIIFLPVVLSVFIVQEPNQQQIGCRNPQGQVVEWFAIITTPQIVHNKDPASGFLYYDSTMTTDTFTLF